MNNPNPFVPKGSILEQQSKRRSRLKIAVFCVLVVGVAGLSAMLIQGCKREQPADTTDTTATPIDTTVTPQPSVTDTSTPPMTATSSVVTPSIQSNTVSIPIPPQPTESAAGLEYVIVQGDTLGKIAKKNGVTLKAIEAANPGVIPTKLRVGQKISIPAATASASIPTAVLTGVDTSSDTYTVKSGDTLTKIAKANGTTIKALQSENNLSTTRIKVGQKLKIPAKAVAAAPEPAPVAPLPSSPVPPSSAAPTN
jgi:LysM repeat protein